VKFLGLLLLIVVALAGCGKLEDRLYGTWKGQVDPDVSSAADASRLGFVLQDFHLELKKDHTYLVKLGIPFEGNWSLHGNHLSCQQTKVMGAPVADAEKYMGQVAELGKAMDKTKAKDMDKLSGAMRMDLNLNVGEDGKTITGSLQWGSLSNNRMKVIFKKDE